LKVKNKMDNEVLITNQPIVIDNGSGMIKAGFAGDPIPKVNFPNYVGRPKHVRVMAGGLEGDTFIGPKAEEYRGLLNISHPMEHGIVEDWNDIEKIWTYVYSKDQLRSASEEVCIYHRKEFDEFLFYLASCFINGSTIKSTKKSRKSCRNLFRNI
jgi:hypothetical protein